MNSAPGNIPPAAGVLLAKAQALLSDALTERDAACRYPVLATADAEGGANARILILRAFDAECWRVTLHTDRRSAKVCEIGASKAASLVFYDHGAALQIRMRGTAAIIRDEKALANAWRDLPEGNKPNYRSAGPPGAFVESTDAAPARPGETDGYENFAMIRLAPDSVDVLQLSPQGNRRYRFDPVTGQGSWLVP
ncbi:pyridoxamine 5'-phosphate oxidase family protein [Nisaea sediminum]|uniref:pyridoxamine 5'-phosphate oxidase family protein n=1 Tax=Nisaea sediminum TaxID=2775867 RepID=UPI001865F236|nr:pyridoxamine 5'-phosphate oxidase family protein [Nisaea sediminum]